MKINLTNAYNVYKKNRENPVSGSDTASKSKQPMSAAKMDTISISSNAAQKNEIGKIAHSIASDIERSVTPQRMQALKDAVGSNGYFIPTDRLADAIIGTFE